MGLPIPLRAWRDSDLDAALEVLRLTHDADAYPTMWWDDVASFAHPADAIGSWVAEGEDGELLGHVCIRPAHGPPLPTWEAGTGRSAEELAQVSRLYVSPAGRRRGAGRILLSTAQAAIRDRGLVAVLDVLWRYESAIRLYEAAGWSRLGAFVWSMPNGTEEPSYGYALLT